MRSPLPSAKNTLLFASPIFYVGIRMLVAGAILLVLHGVIRKSQGNSTQRLTLLEWRLIAKIAFFGIFIAYGFDLWSLQYITSGESALIFSLSPFIAALFSYLWFSEVMTLKKWLGLFVGVFSLLPLVVGSNASVGINIENGIPLIVLICSVAASAYSWIYGDMKISNDS